MSTTVNPPTQSPPSPGPTPTEKSPLPQTVAALTLRELEEKCQQEPEEYVVDLLVPPASVNIAVGDSGLGKSPWVYQLSLCVAAGVPFLGLPVKQGRVLHIDLENGLFPIHNLCKRLGHHLGLKEPPEDLLILPPQASNLGLLENFVRKYGPQLVVIDSLRSFHPRTEESNADAAEFLHRLHAIAKRYDVAFLLIHHIKKPSENGVPALEDTPVMSWSL